MRDGLPAIPETKCRPPPKCVGAGETSAAAQTYAAKPYHSVMTRESARSRASGRPSALKIGQILLGWRQYLSRGACTLIATVEPWQKREQQQREGREHLQLGPRNTIGTGRSVQ